MQFLIQLFCKLGQCSSTFFVKVHPKNLATSSCTVCLKFEMRQKATSKLTCKKTIAPQSALRITQDRAHNKFKKLSAMTFLLLHTNIPNRGMISFLIAPSSMDRCVWLNFFCEIWSHTRKKKHFRINTSQVNWPQTNGFVTVISSQSEDLGKMALGIAKYFYDRLSLPIVILWFMVSL